MRKIKCAVTVFRGGFRAVPVVTDQKWGALGQALVALPFVIFLFILPFPGTVALRLLCLAAAFTIAVFSWRRFSTPALPCRWPIVLWAGVVLVSMLYAVDPEYSLGEIKNEVGYALMAFVAFFAWTRSRAQLGIACLGLAAGFAVIAAASSVDYFSTGAWPPAPFYGGYGSISAYLAAVGPVLFLALAIWRPPHVRYWVLGLGLVFLMVVAFNEQRALWLVLAFQGGIILIWIWKSRAGSNVVARMSFARFLMGMALLVAVTAGGLYLTHQARVDGDPAASQAFLAREGRPAAWWEIGKRIMEQPFTGAGFGRRAMSKAYPELIPADNPLISHGHNVVLNYGISAGVPGMIAVITLFAALGTKFWRLSMRGALIDRMVGLAGTTMVAGVFMRNMPNDFFVRDGALLFWALTGMLMGYALRNAQMHTGGDAHA